MGLQQYNSKRHFDRTAEPRGRIARSAPERLRFVVQKHAASTLHYDFRLEMEGVLRSWAVTKEPAADPAVKRLAVRTEDHPLDYARFEGDIPEGEYGGGHVDIWDEGRWIPEDAPVTAFRAEGPPPKGALGARAHGQRADAQEGLVAADEGQREGWTCLTATVWRSPAFASRAPAASCFPSSASPRRRSPAITTRSRSGSFPT
jgi:bifunctional non-homologous end joining protein LigD